MLLKQIAVAKKMSWERKKEKNILIVEQAKGGYVWFCANVEKHHKLIMISIFLPTYLSAYLPTYLPAYLVCNSFSLCILSFTLLVTTYLPTYLPMASSPSDLKEVSWNAFFCFRNIPLSTISLSISARQIPLLYASRALSVCLLSCFFYLSFSLPRKSWPQTSSTSSSLLLLLQLLICAVGCQDVQT